MFFIFSFHVLPPPLLRIKCSALLRIKAAGLCFCRAFHRPSHRYCESSCNNNDIMTIRRQRSCGGERSCRAYELREKARSMSRATFCALDRSDPLRAVAYARQAALAAQEARRCKLRVELRHSPRLLYRVANVIVAGLRLIGNVRLPRKWPTYFA